LGEQCPTNHCTEARNSDSLIKLARFGGSVNSAVRCFLVKREIVFCRTSKPEVISKMKARILIVSFLAVLYGASIFISFYLDISFLKFLLALPWSMVIAMLGFLLIHMFSGNVLDYGLFIGALLNLVLFLWLFLFKPLIDKSAEIPD
jgi:hypothetical protein